MIAALASLTLASLAGCTSHVAAVEPRTLQVRFPFLREGDTTREEVLARLGAPDSRYDDDRVFTYRLREDARGRWVTGHVPSRALIGRDPLYNLVLVFGADHKLERAALLRKE